MATSKFLNLDLFNNTTSPMPLSLQVNRQESLLDNQDRRWLVGVNRFHIPSELIPAYNPNSAIHPLANYEIGYYSPNYGGITNNNVIIPVLDQTVDEPVNSIADLTNILNHKLSAVHYQFHKENHHLVVLKFEALKRAILQKCQGVLGCLVSLLGGMLGQGDWPKLTSWNFQDSKSTGQCVSSHAISRNMRRMQQGAA